jgi:hypothetical protein
MLTNAEEFTSSSETVPVIKENIKQSLQDTSFESDIIVPKLALSENRKEKKRESKSRKELEEEEREKMQYVQFFWHDSYDSLLCTSVHTCVALIKFILL